MKFCIISHFGILGIMGVVGLTVSSVKAILQFRGTEFGCDSFELTLKTIRAAGGICLISYLFIRNPGGYFQLPFLLALSMLTISMPKIQMKKHLVTDSSHQI